MLRKRNLTEKFQLEQDHNQSITLTSVKWFLHKNFYPDRFWAFFLKQNKEFKDSETFASLWSLSLTDCTCRQFLFKLKTTQKKRKKEIPLGEKKKLFYSEFKEKSFFWCWIVVVFGLKTRKEPEKQGKLWKVSTRDHKRIGRVQRIKVEKLK